jgi:hypothetical protein
MPVVDMGDQQSTSEDESSVADCPSLNSQTTDRRRPRACLYCQAQKVRCEAANDESSDLNCSASQTRRNSKRIPRPKTRLPKTETEPLYRTHHSKSREDSKELPPEGPKGLNALLHVSIITPNERNLLSAFLPPKPNTYLDLNAVMRGQVIPNCRDQGVFTSSMCPTPKNDFDTFFDVYGGSEDNQAESTPQSI